MVFIAHVNHDVVAKVNHDQTILFIVHVDYVIVFEDFRDQDDVFRSLRSPRYMYTTTLSLLCPYGAIVPLECCFMRT